MQEKKFDTKNFEQELSDKDLENVVAGKGTSQQAVIAGGRGKSVIAQQGRGKQQAVIGGRRR